ncbi:MAG: histidine kinase, partial [Betaproteobacteria bacterium]|nr:histidine kinase [Betaproteobacteria bacterium]
MLTPSSKPSRNWKPAIEGILFTLAWLTLTNITIYFIYVRAVEAVKEQIREGLLRNVSAAATLIDGDQHKLFTSKAFKNDQGYINLITRLERVRKASRDVKYAYTNIIKGDKVYFIANGSPQADNDKDGRPDEAPQLMDPYPDAGLALRDALRFQKPTVDKEPYTDAWGTFYSAYAPFKDSKGKFVGTLGMDLELVTLKAR